MASQCHLPPPHKFNRQWKSHTYLYSSAPGHHCTLVCTTFHPTNGTRLSWPGRLIIYPRWYTHERGHPSNRARRRLTMMINFDNIIWWAQAFFFCKRLEKNHSILKIFFSKNLVRKIQVMGITTVESSYTTVVNQHRVSTSMYSLTFCIRVMSPERHHWKPAVQAAVVMLRTPAVDGQSPASQPRPLAIYRAQC